MKKALAIIGLSLTTACQTAPVKGPLTLLTEQRLELLKKQVDPLLLKMKEAQVQGDARLVYEIGYQIDQRLADFDDSMDRLTTSNPVVTELQIMNRRLAKQNIN